MARNTKGGTLLLPIAKAMGARSEVSMNGERFLRCVSGVCACLILLSIAYVIYDNRVIDAGQGAGNAPRQRACVVTGPVLAFAEEAKSPRAANTAAAISGAADGDVYVIESVNLGTSIILPLSGYEDATSNFLNPYIDYSSAIGDGEQTESYEYTVINEDMWVQASRADVRRAPDNVLDAYTHVKKGEKVVCLAVAAEGWAHIRLENGDTGYVDVTNLTKEKPAAIRTETKTETTPNKQQSGDWEPPTQNTDGEELSAATSPRLAASGGTDNNGYLFYGVVNGIEVYSDNSVTDKILNSYISSIKRLDSRLAQANVRSIIITTRNLKEVVPSLTRYHTRILGVTDVASGRIYINGNVYNSVTICHEMIHVWDYRNMGNISGSPEFSAIYAAEKHAVAVSKGNDQLPREFLASSAEIFFSNPSHLRGIAPMTYAFLAQYFG